MVSVPSQDALTARWRRAVSSGSPASAGNSSSEWSRPSPSAPGGRRTSWIEAISKPCGFCSVLAQSHLPKQKWTALNRRASGSVPCPTGGCPCQCVNGVISGNGSRTSCQSSETGRPVLPQVVPSDWWKPTSTAVVSGSVARMRIFTAASRP